MNEVECLGFSGSPTGSRTDRKKLESIRDYATLESAEEIDNFLRTSYLRKLIPGRAEHACRMKDAVQNVPEWKIKAGTNKDGTPERTMSTRITGSLWGSAQKETFSATKRAFIHTIPAGEETLDFSSTWLRTLLDPLMEEFSSRSLLNWSGPVFAAD